MKLRFVDKTTTPITGTNQINATLEIIKNDDMTTEEIFNMFNIPGNLQTIEIVNDNDEVVDTFFGWIRLSNVRMENGNKVVVLINEADVTAERLAKAESGALDAAATVKEAKLQMETVKEEMTKTVSDALDQIAEKADTVEKAAANVEAQKAAVQVVAQSFDDADALSVKAVYPTYEETIGKEVSEGYKVQNNDSLYKATETVVVQDSETPEESTSFVEITEETVAADQAAKVVTPDGTDITGPTA